MLAAFLEVKTKAETQKSPKKSTKKKKKSNTLTSANAGSFVNYN